MREPASGDLAHPQGAISKADKSDASSQLALFPVLHCYFSGEESIRKELQRYEVTGQTVMVANRPCLVLQDVKKSAARRELLYLDRDRDYVMVRRLVLVGDQPQTQMDVSYSPDPVVGWRPSEWEYMIRAGKPSSIVESERRVVTSCVINAEIPDSDFRIDFPAGTRVIDRSSGQEMHSVVRDDGVRGGEVPAKQRPTYEKLASTPPDTLRSTAKQVVFWVSSLLALVLLTVLVRRISKRKRV